MNLTTNDLLIVIGEQTLNIKALTMHIEAQAKRIQELEPPKDNVVPIGGADGSS